jgi:hypothetical protein
MRTEEEASPGMLLRSESWLILNGLTNSANRETFSV